MIKLSPNNEVIRIPPGWARLLALLIMLICIGLFMAGVLTWFTYAPEHPEAFTAYSWSVEETERLFNRIDLSFQSWINIQLASGLITAACYCVVGMFIFARKKNDWFGLYVSIVLVLYGTITSSQVSILKDQYPWTDSLLQPLSVITWALWFIIFYLFPDGRFVPRWMRWFAVLLLLGFAIDIMFYRGDTPPTWLAVVLLPGIAIGLISQVYRYWRVSGPVERQQTKWVLFAILVLGFSLIIGMISILFPQLDVDSPGALFLLIYTLVSSLLILIFPISIGFAILRYRLWDVDVIIRRTLVYSALSLLLGLVYFGMVTLLQNLFASITGEQSTPAIVLSTLAIAALFNPLRRRLQDLIDRRFYRKKYDAERTLAAFAKTAREATDLEALSAELLRVVQDTMQPIDVRLWVPRFNLYHSSKPDHE